MNMHIKELNALYALKQKSEILHFAKGAGSAITQPVKGVVKSISNPVAASKNIYTAVENTVSNVQDGVPRESGKCKERPSSVGSYIGIGSLNRDSRQLQ